MGPVGPVGNSVNTVVPSVGLWVYWVVPSVGYWVYWVVCCEGCVGICVVAVGLAQIVL